MKKAVFLGTLLGALLVVVVAAKAQAPMPIPLNSVAHELSGDEASRVWAAVGGVTAQNGYGKQSLEDNFSYPSFAGIITVEAEPNESWKRRMYLTIPTIALVIDGQFVARLIWPNRDTVEVATGGWKSVNPADSGYYRWLLMDWSTLRQGIYRVEVFAQESGGRISKIAASIPVGWCCPAGPNIGTIGITPTSPDGANISFAGGAPYPSPPNYKNPTVAVAGIPLKIVEKIPDAVIAQLPRLSEGEYTATLCDQGECTTRPFYYSPSFNQSATPPFGKGNVPGSAQ